MTPRRPRLTHPRRRRPLPREAGREPRSPRGVRRGGEGGESWGRRLLPAKAAAAAPQLLGRWRRMERGGGGGEGATRGSPSLLLPSCPPPHPAEPLAPWSPVLPAGGETKAAGEGGREPAERAGRGAGAGGGGNGRREEEGGRRRGEEEEAETLLGNRISATNSIHHQKTPLGRGAGSSCPAAGPSVQGRRPRTAASPRGPGSRLPAPSFLPPGAAAGASCRRRRGACC